jgi:hypothetical protein
MGVEDVFRYTPSGRYPSVHGASGYSSCHVPAVRPEPQAKQSKIKSAFGDFHRNWSGLVLSSLLVAWGGFLRW